MQEFWNRRRGQWQSSGDDPAKSMRERIRQRIAVNFAWDQQNAEEEKQADQ